MLIFLVLDIDTGLWIGSEATHVIPVGMGQNDIRDFVWINSRLRSFWDGWT